MKKTLALIATIALVGSSMVGCNSNEALASQYRTTSVAYAQSWCESQDNGMFALLSDGPVCKTDQEEYEFQFKMVDIESGKVAVTAVESQFSTNPGNTVEAGTFLHIGGDYQK